MIDITHPWSWGSLINTSRWSELMTLRTNGERTCIIGTDYQYNISVWEVLIDFIHLEHDCGPALVCGLHLIPQQLTIVGYASLC